MRVDFLWTRDGRCEAQGFLQRAELKTHITVFVKVFHGKRETHEFSVSILDKIHVIYERLLQKDRSAMK